jgi:hypothetical protein
MKIHAAKNYYSGSQINEVYRNPVLSSFPGQNSYLTFLRKAIQALQSRGVDVITVAETGMLSRF